MPTNARTFYVSEDGNEDVKHSLQNFGFQSNRRCLSRDECIIVYGDMEVPCRTFPKLRSSKRTKTMQIAKMRFKMCKENIDAIASLLISHEFSVLKNLARKIQIPSFIMRCTVTEKYLRKKHIQVPDNWSPGPGHEGFVFHGIATTYVRGQSLHSMLMALEEPQDFAEIKRFGIIDFEDMMCKSVPQNWTNNNSVFQDGCNDGTRFPYSEKPGNKPSDFIWWRMLACLAPIIKNCEVLVAFYSSIMMMDGMPITDKNMDYLASPRGGFFSTKNCQIMIQSSEDLEKRLDVLRHVTFQMNYMPDKDEMRVHFQETAWQYETCQFMVRLIENFIDPLCRACNKADIYWFDCKPDNVIVCIDEDV